MGLAVFVLGVIEVEKWVRHRPHST